MYERSVVKRFPVAWALPSPKSRSHVLAATDGSVDTPQTTSDAPIRKSRLGISRVSADALVAAIRTSSAMADPSPSAPFRSYKLLISGLHRFGNVCRVCARRLGHALQEIGQLSYLCFIGVRGDLPTWQTPVGRL